MVVSRTHTMESYVEDNVNGLLVPQHDATAMKNAIVELLKNPPKRQELGKAARVYAEKNLDMMKCSEQLRDFFQSLTAR